jgi:FecR protein
MAGKVVMLALAAAFAATCPAFAQVVGTATAVNPTSESTPPGGSTVALNIGAHVVHKERIHTSPTGSVQLLFVDKSSLSIAPNTNILIDEFVYDPAAGNGHMLTKLTEGTMQYIGGKLSHEGAVTIGTPEATIGIRGGTATISQGPDGTTVINQFGTLTISNGGGTIVVTRPGFVVTITNWNSPPAQPVRVTDAQVIHYIEYLSSKFGQNGGYSGLTTIQYACGAAGAPACPLPPWQDNNTGESNAFQIIVESTQRATSVTPPPPPQPPPCTECDANTVPTRR